MYLYNYLVFFAKERYVNILKLLNKFRYSVILLG